MSGRFEPFASVCVYCGSRPGADPMYSAHAKAVGKGLAEAGLRLVYGAGSTGLMGAVGGAARDSGGRTFGVIPTHLIPTEGQLRDIGQLVVTENMHERKKVMVMNSDAFVLLPGGGGSMEEFFEVLTWAQLGLHEKPIYVLNTNGYWDKLLALLEHFVEQELADPSSVSRLEIVGEPDALLDLLKRRFCEPDE